MKKVVCIIAVILSFSVLCFAEEEEKIKNLWETKHEPLIKEIRRNNTVQAVIAIGTNTFAGTVDSIEQPGLGQGVKNGVTVIDGKGEKMSFTLTPGMNMISKDGKPTFVRDLRTGDKIIVEYSVTKGGVNKAMSITQQ
jgi:hypothetical protein